MVKRVNQREVVMMSEEKDDIVKRENIVTMTEDIGTITKMRSTIEMNDGTEMTEPGFSRLHSRLLVCVFYIY